MERELRNRIDYTVICIGEFADRFDMHPQQAYQYLKKYGGIDFLRDSYEAEHLLSIEDAVDDLAILCRRNGGKIA